MSTYERIYAAVRKVPRGRVATYGQIATIAGLPGHARQVGYALHALLDPSVPWHRVINAKGEISLSGASADEQRGRLEREGVSVDARGKIDLSAHAWRPRSRR